MLSLFFHLPDRWTKLLVHGLALLRSPYIIGVRVIVEDSHHRILLVRHSYLKGWYLPGGGVDRGESLHEAASRELNEEAGIAATVEPRLLGMYLNEDASGRDHVGLFQVSAWRETDSYLQPNAEIREAAFFGLDDLPEDVTPATARRLAEFTADAFPVSGKW